MNRLPQNRFFDSFYIWFNSDKKKECFSTLYYFYYTKNGNIADRRFFLELEKDIATVKSTDNEITYKHPATFYISFVEQFGGMSINVLNADKFYDYSKCSLKELVSELDNQENIV